MEIALTSTKRSRLYKYVAVFFVALIGTVLVLKIKHFSQLLIPFEYHGDALFYLMTIKSIVTNGWYLTDPSIGAPGGHSLADFPMADGLNYLIIKFLSLFTSNWALIFNLFFLLTFPLIAISALFVLKRLGLNTPLAITASLLFTWLPFHYIRGENHLFLSAYYIVPLAIWLTLLLYQQRVFLADRKRVFWLLFLCLLIGSTGVYYAFFTCFFLLIAGLIATHTKRSLWPLGQAAILIGAISTAIILNILPTLIYHRHHGENPKAAHRSQYESEKYGLKIAQLVLPIDHSRIALFAKLKRHYNHYGVLINENATASLGLIGSTGLIFLLVWVFRKNREESHLSTLSHLNLCALLLATVGGFSSLFALFVSPSIRAYNRISVFIAFFALTAFFLCLQNWIEKKQLKTAAIWQLSLFLLLLGLFDQTSPHYSLTKRLAANQKKLQQDQGEISQIEALLAPKSMVFQLPYLPFPESGPVHNLDNYDLFRAPLFSQHLKWSFGAIRGREIDAWQKTTSALAAKQMLEQLIAMGFSGLYLNRHGYSDHGEAKQLELSCLLDRPTFESDNIFFWDLNCDRSKSAKNAKEAP